VNDEHSVPLEDARAYAAYGQNSVVRKLLKIRQETPGRINVGPRPTGRRVLMTHDAAAAAAEAAALQDRFWEMHELLFHRQKALEDDDLQRYAAELQLDVARFDLDRLGPDVLRRVRRDVESGRATGVVRGTPTLFIDGVVHLDAPTLLEALAET
jgi:predicted DsbA family dithiol-disulfide isomerase